MNASMPSKPDESGPDPKAVRPAHTLTSAARKALRAEAHHLDPVVMIGDSGLTAAVVAETDRALAAHQLIKVRVLGDDRQARARILEELCASLGCAPVQSIGKLLVIWRPLPEAPAASSFVPKKLAAQAAAKPAKSSSPAKPGRSRTSGSATDKKPRRSPSPSGQSGLGKTAGASKRSKVAGQGASFQKPVSRTNRSQKTAESAGRSSNASRSYGSQSTPQTKGPAPRPTNRTGGRSTARPSSARSPRPRGR
jgi:RNA-binding protein